MNRCDKCGIGKVFRDQAGDESCFACGWSPTAPLPPFLGVAATPLPITAADRHAVVLAAVARGQATARAVAERTGISYSLARSTLAALGARGELQRTRRRDTAAWVYRLADGAEEPLSRYPQS